MLNKKEITSILSVSILLGILISSIQIDANSSTEEIINLIAKYFLIILGVIFINILFKKIVAFYLDAQIEIETWKIQRFGYKTHQHFKHKIEGGIFIPILIKLLTFPFAGGINWMSVLTFDAQGKIYRAVKRHGIYSTSQIREAEIAYIAGAGIIANLFFAWLAWIIGFPLFSKLSLQYAFFQTIPLSDLDGTKMFFGSKIWWGTLTILSLFGLLASFTI